MECLCTAMQLHHRNENLYSMYNAMASFLHYSANCIYFKFFLSEPIRLKNMLSTSLFFTKCEPRHAYKHCTGV